MFHLFLTILSLGYFLTFPNSFFYFFFFLDSWISICSPFIPKYLSSPRSVCVDGTIYLVADNTKKVYCYDPEVNMWQKVGLYITADYSHNTAMQSLESMLI